MKKSLILQSDITHKELFEKALQMDKQSRMKVMRDLDLYRSVYNWLGKIERPDFENDNERLVRRKYVPNSKHEAFYRAASEDAGKGRWLLGGNRSGKTETGIREDVSFSLGFRPFFDRSDSDFNTPVQGGTKGRIFGEDWEKAIKGTIVPKLYSTIPPELLISVKKGQMGVESLFKIKVPFDATKKISTIELLTNKSDVRSVEGWDGDWIHFDEPTRQNIFIAATRGLVDRNGYFWFTLTPLSEPWILDDIVNNHDYTGFYVSSYENLYDPETGAGYLTEAGLDNYIKKIKDPAERQARLYGEFKHLSGAVFKQFSPDKHIYPNEFIKMEEIPETWWRDCFIDPGVRKPHCVTFVAWSPRGDMYVYDGFRIGDARYADDDFPDLIPATPTATELIEEIKKRCIDWPQRFYVDPMADVPSLDTGTSLLSLLSEEFPVEKWPKIDKEKAIAPLTSLMKVDEVTGKPRVFVHHKMTRAIYELERYRWDEWASSSSRKYKPKVIKEDDDYVDCMIAAALNPPPDMKDDKDLKPNTLYFEY